MKEYYCRNCGRKLTRKFPQMLCQKHYDQLKQYGEFLDDSQRDVDDPNEIIIQGDFAEIILYDFLFEPLEDTILIDVEDVEKIKNYSWQKKKDCIVGLQYGRTVLLPNIILDTENKIEYINGDILDNRKENLKEVKKRTKKNKNITTVSKRNKNKIMIEFIGESHNGVVGSSIVCSYPTKEGEYERVLIEMGMIQRNGALKEEYVINKEVIDRVLSYGNFNAVFVSHAHLDHTGLLPTLVDYTDRYIMTYENKELLQPLLCDGAYILQKNCKVLENKKYKATPFYTEQDVYRLLNKTSVYNKNEIYKLNEYVSFRFLPNNHIVGATSIELFFKTPSGNIKKVYYSGDMGSPNNQQPFCDVSIIPTNANVIITEATYSDLSRNFNKHDIKKEREKMLQDIKNELKEGRSILFGAFAMSRTQNLLNFLYENFADDPNFKTPIYLDGKLSLQINNVYRNILKDDDKRAFNKILEWEMLHFVNQFEDSMNLALRKDEQKIVISSAGMFNIGRIVNHLKANIENKNYTIMIIGYCAPSTVGGQLLNEHAKEVKIEGLSYKKLAKIIRYKTWSSHIQGLELVKMLKGINTSLIILHHSDESKYDFRDYMEEEFRLSGNTTKIICADENNKIFFI